MRDSDRMMNDNYDEAREDHHPLHAQRVLQPQMAATAVTGLGHRAFSFSQRRSTAPWRSSGPARPNPRSCMRPSSSLASFGLGLMKISRGRCSTATASSGDQAARAADRRIEAIAEPDDSLAPADEPARLAHAEPSFRTPRELSEPARDSGWDGSAASLQYSPE